MKWEESGCTSLVHHPHEYSANVQAGLDFSSAKDTWDGLLSCYAQADPIAQNLAQKHLHMKCFVEGGTETLPAHIAELQRLIEACRGLGVDITDPQFSGIIMLSIPIPSWDLVIGTLGGILDPKIIILHLSTEWSRRQGHTSTGCHVPNWLQDIPAV